MRLSILIAVIFLLPHSAKCQYESFFGTISTSWTSVGTGMAANEWTDSAAYEKDTLIAGIEYKKISCWKAYPDNVYCCDAFFREDTTTGKLWARYPSDTEDVLIADMSLSIGDQYITPVSLVPKTVDSIYFINSRKYIRFNSSYNGIKFQFFEGVGPSVGPLWVEGLILLCQYKDGNQNYVLNTPAYPGICNVSQLTSIIEPPKESISIYPNPTRGLIKIECADRRPKLTIYVHDVLGRQMLVKDCFGGTPCDVDLSHLSPGVIMLMIHDDRNVVLKQEKILLN